MSDCTDVCEVVIDTLMNLGYSIKTDEDDEDHADVLDAFCKYNQSYADLLAACKYTIESLKKVKGKAFPIMPIIDAIAKAEQADEPERTG